MKKGERLNILFVAHERKLGGATLSLLGLIKELQRKGHYVSVIVPTSVCPLAKELKKRKIKIYPVFFAWWQMPVKWNCAMKVCFKCLYALEYLQLIILYARLKNVKIDIVHTNSSVTDLGARLAKKLRVRHIWHVREFGDADYDLEYMLGKEKTWAYMKAHSDYIIFISRNLKKYFEKYLDGVNVKVIYNGISDAYLCQRQYQEKGYINFLIAGNLNRNKNQMLVLKASKILLEQGIQNFRVYVAGTSTSMLDSRKYENELKAYAQENLGSKVVFLGRIEDMVSLRKDMDVELVASNREAFGRVTVEAMFSGMPVIASEEGANKELIEEGKTGFFFASGDSQMLAQKMYAFIEDYEKVREMGETALSSASTTYTALRNADEVEEIYFKVLEWKEV